MRICLVSAYYSPDPSPPDPQDFLAGAPLSRNLARALAAHGHDVHVVQMFPRPGSWTEGNVSFHFVPASNSATFLARGLGRVSGREWTRAVLALTALRTVRALQPDVIHFHGLLLTLNLAALRLLLRSATPPVVGQYHGGFPTPNPFWRSIQRHTLRRLDRALFSTIDDARPFVEAGLLTWDQVVELMEVSSHFHVQPRSQARAVTGMTGRPVFLWAGRLHPVKDPLTALRGFARIQSSWTDAQLYLYYLTDELLPQLQSYLEARPGLRAHVHFRGRVPHHEMEAVMNSADFLLQASRREFSGFAVLEAMACGVVPVVTDIPSFRKMTDGGRYGVLFPRGDDARMAEEVLALDPTRITEYAAAVHERFRRDFSYQAMADRLLDTYFDELEARSR